MCLKEESIYESLERRKIVLRLMTKKQWLQEKMADAYYIHKVKFKIYFSGKNRHKTMSVYIANTNLSEHQSAHYWKKTVLAVKKSV